jgi:histidine triad (HIT) family protein
VASLFTKIIQGALPGRFVWRDERAVAFLTINPIKPGHTLVVPIQEVAHWIELEPALAGHLMQVGQAIGRGIQRAFSPVRVGMMVVGLEVPHVHLHVTPIWEVGDVSFARAERDPKPADLDAAADRLRRALRDLGYGQVAS